MPPLLRGSRSRSRSRSRSYSRSRPRSRSLSSRQRPLAAHEPSGTLPYAPSGSPALRCRCPRGLVGTAEGRREAPPCPAAPPAGPAAPAQRSRLLLWRGRSRWRPGRGAAAATTAARPGRRLGAERRGSASPRTSLSPSRPGRTGAQQLCRSRTRASQVWLLRTSSFNE
ncbi:uncharacterized protein [Anomalospiza imberbis]|uniref:uncharacterized protein n=1 Tax=Anomalospiza imberbis TaxID=187417 RepID=UPI00358DE482